MRITAAHFLVCSALNLVLSAHFAYAEGLHSFSEQERQVVDQRVKAAPDLRTQEPKQEFYGTLARWSIARTPMKAEEELELARAEHEAILKGNNTTPTPELADQVLKRLTNQLPGSSSPQFEYSLTIIESAEYRSYTVGGGFLYLTRPLYQELTGNAHHAEDRLAFVLAHEMGHIARKHCRVAYQLLKLESLGQREGLDEVDLSKLRGKLHQMVERTGDRLRFLYEPQQEYQADLFAAHLCRNAGFDREAGWDVLRQGVLSEESHGILLNDPAHAMLAYANSARSENRPLSSDRLRQLCFDRDGVIAGDQYGLWEFDTRSDQWIKPEQLQISQNESAVLLVHGMDSSLSSCYLNLARELAKDHRFLGVRILGFQYPGDASLCRVGEFLYREISRSCHPKAKIDFVCHSAGGLVTRYYAEIKRGSFERILLQGTPNHGSDWGRLRGVIEIKQFVGDLRDGYSQAIENAILDGQGQIAQDLQPNSLFLNYVNSQQVDRSRFAVFRGRRFGRTRMFFLNQSLEIGQKLLVKSVPEIEGPNILRERAMQSLAQLHLPEEIRKGDLVVSTESAALGGVENVQTFKLNHGQLSREPATIAAALEFLSTKP